MLYSLKPSSNLVLQLLKCKLNYSILKTVLNTFTAYGPTELSVRLGPIRPLGKAKNMAVWDWHHVREVLPICCSSVLIKMIETDQWSLISLSRVYSPAYPLTHNSLPPINTLAFPQSHYSLKWPRKMILH